MTACWGGRALVAVLLLLSPVVVPAQNTPRRSVAIVGVTVIDPASTGPAPRNQTILVTDGIIRATGPVNQVRIPRDARRVDGTGKFVIPGLWDAHVHFMNTGPGALSLLLAHGVTSVREMGGYIDSTRAWQARWRAGILPAPRIVTPGPILESPRYLQGVRERSARGDGRLAARVLPYRIGVADSTSARMAIDSLKRLGVDFVKVRTTASPEAYFALLREARRAGLAVAGHQPSVVPLLTAVDSGQSDIEHGFTPPLRRLSEAERDTIYARMAARGTWYTPTLVVSRAVKISGDSAARAIFGPDAERLDPRRRYASTWLLEWWRTQVDERRADTSSASRAALTEGYESSVEDVRRMVTVGVRILAGTDAGSVLVYPGFSLHEELALLVQAGLSPRAALWSATAGPAQFAGLEAKLGRIATGWVADLVILNADPLQDVRNSMSIYAVMQNGRLYPRAELDRMLENVRNPGTSH